MCCPLCCSVSLCLSLCSPFTSSLWHFHSCSFQLPLSLFHSFLSLAPSLSLSFRFCSVHNLFGPKAFACFGHLIGDSSLHSFAFIAFYPSAIRLMLCAVSSTGHILLPRTVGLIAWELVNYVQSTYSGKLKLKKDLFFLAGLLTMRALNVDCIANTLYYLM